MEVKFSSLVKRSLAQSEDSSSVAISDPGSSIVLSAMINRRLPSLSHLMIPK